MIKWLDIKLSQYSNPAESIQKFSEEFNMTFEEAHELFEVWMRVEDHRNWYEEMDTKEVDCEGEGATWE